MNNILELFDRVTISESLAVKLENTEMHTCQLDMDNNSVKITLKADAPFNRGELLAYADAIKQVYNLNLLYIYMGKIRDAESDEW